MQNGYFKDETKEYVITNMFTPRPWVNYLWNENQMSLVNQFGFGKARYQDDNAFQRNFTAEDENRLVYIKDGGEYYAANRNYDNLPFDRFETVVGQGYTVIRSSYKGLDVDYKIFVPQQGRMECWEVTLENTKAEDKEFDLYVFADIDAAVTSHDAYMRADFDEELNGIYCSHNGFQSPTKYVGTFFAAEKKPCAYETALERFKGIYNDLRNPIALESDILSSKGTCFEHNAMCAFQYKVKLAAGEKTHYLFAIGAVKDRKEAVNMSRLLTSESFDKELCTLKKKADMYDEQIRINTPDEEINRRVNIWLKRQLELGKTWGRVYGKGFRDIMQDISAFIQLDPKTARTKILYCAEHQFDSGNTIRQWEPVDKYPYRDGATWMIHTVSTYIKETGDFDILNENVPYYESDESGTLLDHCKRGMKFMFGGLGEHGLCLWGGGDWNDSINACGLLGRGESVWLSEATVYAANEFAVLLDKIGEDSSEIRANSLKLKENTNKYGWDKDHYIYGINDWGEKVGSYDTKEGQIFLNAQVWAILSGISEGKDAKELMRFVEREMKCPYGYVQQKPSYSEGSDRIGRVSYMQKGCYENGSVYNHGVTFKIVADCKLRNGDAAYESINLILPKNPALVNAGVEEYAISNMYLGPENEFRKAVAPMSWITGTSGWLFRGIVEYMLGIRADFDGLIIDPVLPKTWKKLSAVRKYRGTVYEIEMENGGGDTAKINVDGKEISGNVVPAFSDGKTHAVKVVM
ncbi:MAG: hypothetical protein PUB42_01275 [Firmicutes bacterium]|nr:hypothetical protein [Bacillota bacterium]